MRYTKDMKSFSKKEALLVGWQTFKERPFFLIGLFVLTTLISVLTGWVADQVPHGGANVALNLIDFAVQIILGMGMTLILLRVYDKAHTDYTDLLEPIHLFWKYFVMTVLVVIITSIGFVLFVVPGIVAAIALVFAPYLVVDRNMKPLEALQESMHITHGHRWNVLIFGALVFIVNIAGAAAFGLGLFITIPVTALAAVHVYRWLLNPVDDDGVEVAMTSKVLVSLGVVLLLVAAIVGLSSFGTTNTSTPGTAQARDMQRQSDIINIQLALGIFHDVKGVFPDSLDALAPEYIATVPRDPLTHAPYQYLPSSEGRDFDVCAHLEIPTSVTTADGVICKQSLEPAGK